MKKTITLFMALALVSSLFAMPHNPKQFVQGKQKVQIHKAAMGDSTVFTYASTKDSLQTKGGIKVQLGKAAGQSAPAWNPNSNHMRIYANNTITVSATSITKIELTFGKTASNKTYASMTAGTGNYVSGGESTAVGSFVTDTWTGTASKVVFTMGDAGQRAVEKIVVYGEGGGGGDTIKIEDVDGLEIDYYHSYSKAGTYDYTFLLYNSEDENHVPMVAFDILTSAEKSYAGTYTVQGGTVTEYSYYVYGTGDDDYIEFTDAEITITDNGKDNYTIKGWFTDGNDIYSVDVTLDGEYFNVEYLYEPETKSTLNLTVTAGEIDDSYMETYGIVDIYLTTADGEVTLEYYLPSTATAMEDGTYPIEVAEYDEEGYIQQTYGFFDAGYYYSSFGVAVGSNYQTDEDIYYLVGGTVKVETVESGKKITLAGTTYYGSTINAVYTIAATALQTVKAGKEADGKYMMGGKLFIQKNGVLFNAQGQEVR